MIKVGAQQVELGKDVTQGLDTLTVSLRLGKDGEKEAQAKHKAVVSPTPQPQEHLSVALQPYFWVPDTYMMVLL